MDWGGGECWGVDRAWVPACAGMTERGRRNDGEGAQERREEGAGMTERGRGNDGKRAREPICIVKRACPPPLGLRVSAPCSVVALSKRKFARAGWAREFQGEGERHAGT